MKREIAVHKGFAVILVVLLMLGVWVLPIYGHAFASVAAESPVPPDASRIAQIERLIDGQMEQSQIPGLAITIVQGDETVYQRGFGYANTQRRQPVSAESVFELGSTSKAFTGLAVLKLVREGKLKLEDPVTTYIPWLHFNAKGAAAQPGSAAANVTLGQLLFQTSGIPFSTIGDIPEGAEEEALQQTVQRLRGITLEFRPGDRFQYATVNYDVLGYVIEQVTGQSYENYIREQVLQPLGLQHTYVSTVEASRHDEVVQGYKLGYLKARPFDAPIYRGNTPAGYIYTDSQDMALWLKIQLGTVPVNQELAEVIFESHRPDRTVSPDADGSSYAAGWYVYQSGGGELSHSGSNPAYSSFVAFRPEEQIGVAVMANLNSANTLVIGQGILDLLLGKEPVTGLEDTYRTVDRMSVIILVISASFIGLSLWFAVSIGLDLYYKRRQMASGTIMNGLRLLSFAVFSGGVTFAFLQLPEVLFNGVNWDFAEVWAPSSFKTSMWLLYASLLLFALSLLLNALFPKQGRSPLFPFIVLCLVSGIGNTLIIFIINEALARTETFQIGLFSFFLVGLLVYVLSQRIVRTQLIRFTNDLIYDKQTEIIDRVLHSPYNKVEKIAKEKLYSVLNHDIETISGGINVLVFGLTSLITLIFCFVYLGFINVYGLLVSILVISLAALAYYAAGRDANKHWESTRDIQNVFYQYIGHMAQGFKELSLHQAKKSEFRTDLHESCNQYRVKRIKGDTRFANVFVIGEIMFTVVIGVVAFIFPLLFDSVRSHSLRSFVFIFLYMGAPVRGVLDAVPDLIRMRIAWNRIRQLSAELSHGPGAEESVPMRDALDTGFGTLELNHVCYEYENHHGTTFSVGPVNLVLRAGEVTFITGGNGSGKSTLVKLITGLYEPSAGLISMNGRPVSPAGLSEQFTAVFSEYHLFDKLYGVRHSLDEMAVNHHLKQLHLDQKVYIQDGRFSTIQLSSGQRRRLALFISYMEDRPVYLFDEWAADQDPEFRRYFYHSVLPELKKQGKCVIAVTHDDRYFDLADTLVKMEAGQMIQLDTQRNHQVFGNRV
ncbi:cyclic peptide export ABC transporter [Paenibacillus sp. P96]|uniref:Cyclic peptide export ABC transporter n=1 Tax=Paenibacillus zeirhizosphaerae TaxID=2987519 RepID=A0ABT9FWI3_9BACL|nr:cyclic peptide export ABC transporter [Paenibacillus sp. P96]MDP4098847.1 cyclic peptide export ABC transporter [Paenibacillus sp. P96]